MDIPTLKSQLDILTVAQDLGIMVDHKTKRAQCPFHDDAKPSLQFSEEKQICTCFSSDCNAGTMDVIKLTEKKLDITTHAALKYLTEQTGKTTTKPNTKKVSVKADYAADFEQMQSSFVASSTARKYAQSRALVTENVAIGYNAFKSSKFNYLRGCITFGLRDAAGKVVSLYGRSVRDNDKARHYFTTGRKGLFPKYPNAESVKVVLVESVIDAVSLLCSSFLSDKENYAVLALYGVNGLTSEHVLALQKLEDLDEIILFLDGDEAGNQAVLQHGKYLKDLFEEVEITKVETPKDQDINSLLVENGRDSFDSFFHQRSSFFFSIEEKEVETKEVGNEGENLVFNPKGLNTDNPLKLSFGTEVAQYFIKGGIRKELDSLKVTLVIEHLESKAKSRNKLDLYEDKQAEKISREAAEKLGLRADLVERDLSILTDLLDDYREALKEEEEGVKVKKVSVLSSEKEKCIAFLQEENLLAHINQLIGESGVVGEENNRLFLFGIASSYKMPDTLHALIQGSSGSGKTHLLATIMDFMPPEDIISLTRVTESSFYNYGQYDLQHKLIGMEDYDGLEEKAELAFRELQSKGMISSSTSGKNEQTGQITGFIKTVYGPIASLSATTKGEIYEDNMSRCFLVAVDESQEQTLRIIKHQNDRAAGLVSKDKQQEIRDFLRNCIRLLNPYEVVNPFANQIDLPPQAHKIRRLNDLFQSYVKQVTLLNQYQRKRDAQGRLITEKSDISEAIEIMFESIVLKVDELDGSLRGFYESLKDYVLERGKDYLFNRMEVRQALRVSKTQQHVFINQLLDLEYIQQAGGFVNRGFKYKIHHWDDNDKLRTDIQEYLTHQLEKL